MCYVNFASFQEIGEKFLCCFDGALKVEEEDEISVFVDDIKQKMMSKRRGGGKNLWKHDDGMPKAKQLNLVIVFQLKKPIIDAQLRSHELEKKNLFPSFGRDLSKPIEESKPKLVNMETLERS